MNIYYVYAYLRDKDSQTAKAGTPYYIGKGKHRRAFEPHDTIPLPSDKSLIVFLEKKLTNVGSLALERRMIRWYGRQDLGTGILRNRTDGGDGTSLPGASNGMYGKTHSDEVKKMLSKLQKGKKASDDTRKKMSSARTGMKRSDETKQKIGNAHRGKIMSEESRAKMKSAWNDERRAKHIERTKRMNEDRKLKSDAK